MQCKKICFGFSHVTSAGIWIEAELPKMHNSASGIWLVSLQHLCFINTNININFQSNAAVKEFVQHHKHYKNLSDLLVPTWLFFIALQMVKSRTEQIQNNYSMWVR